MSANRPAKNHPWSFSSQRTKPKPPPPPKEKPRGK
jgi:hypothetical protein